MHDVTSFYCVTIVWFLQSVKELPLIRAGSSIGRLLAHAHPISSCHDVYSTGVHTALGWRVLSLKKKKAPPQRPHHLSLRGPNASGSCSNLLRSLALVFTTASNIAWRLLRRLACGDPSCKDTGALSRPLWACVGTQARRRHRNALLPNALLNERKPPYRTYASFLTVLNRRWVFSDFATMR
jgi:hypothetical protein